MKKLFIVLAGLCLLAFSAPVMADDCVEADLEITPSAGPGDLVSFSFELTNCGTEAALADLTFDFTFDTEDIPEGINFSIPMKFPIGAGETYTRSFETTLPPVTPSGSFTVCVEAVIGEATASDCATLVVEGGGPSPASLDYPIEPTAIVNGFDLATSATEVECVEVDLEITPSAGSGDLVSFSFEFTNCGTEAALADLTFDFTFDTEDIPEGINFSIPMKFPIGAGETYTRSFETTLPPVTPSGSFTVCVEAVIGEATASDCATLVVEGGGPSPASVDYPIDPTEIVNGFDLATGVTETDCVEVDVEITSPVQAYDEYTYSFEVINCGTEAAEVELAVDIVMALPSGDVPVAIIKFPLGAGESIAKSFEAVLPPVVPAGSYEVCVTATIGEATDTDCATLEVVEDSGGSDSTGLDQNYPNPFNASTAISFSLAKPATIDLSVYNVLGEKVATIADGFYTEGEHTVNWDTGSMASGMYFYRLTTEKDVLTKKMILTK